MLKNYDLHLLKELFARDVEKTKDLVYLELLKYYEDFEMNEEYIYCEGDIPVLLLAHLDTVYDEQYTQRYYSSESYEPHKSTAILLLEEEIITSQNGLGADDKAGVYIILQILQKGYRPYILFTTDEEILTGESASNFALDYIDKRLQGDFKYMIQLDRRGTNDAVFYYDKNKDFQKYIESFDFKKAEGSYTDITTIAPIINISGVNLSVGYFYEHTYKEFLSLPDMLKTQERVIQMLEDSKDLKKTFYFKA